MPPCKTTRHGGIITAGPASATARRNTCPACSARARQTTKKNITRAAGSGRVPASASAGHLFRWAGALQVRYAALREVLSERKGHTAKSRRCSAASCFLPAKPSYLPSNTTKKSRAREKIRKLGRPHCTLMCLIAAAAQPTSATRLHHLLLSTSSAAITSITTTTALLSFRIVASLLSTRNVHHVG